MPYLLSLDPGLSTGWAVMTKEGRVIACGTIMFEQDVPTILKEINARYYPEVILVEDVPTPTQSELNIKLQFLSNIIRQVFHVYNRCKSADWKPTVIKYWYVPSIMFGYKLTDHTKDAIRMGWWFLKFKRKLEVQKIDPKRDTYWHQHPQEAQIADSGSGPVTSRDPERARKD